MNAALAAIDVKKTITTEKAKLTDLIKKATHDLVYKTQKHKEVELIDGVIKSKQPAAEKKATAEWDSQAHDPEKAEEAAIIHSTEAELRKITEQETTKMKPAAMMD